MTAEIAILNRTAVALAADSAVTVGGSGQEKIYNSVDKLFQLAIQEPVGIMIFGGAEFMGVPIETVIKRYRASRFCGRKNRLKEYSESFFDFLEKDIPVPPEIAERQAIIIIAETCSAIVRQALSDFFQLATESRRRRVKPQPEEFLPKQIITLAEKKIAELEDKPENPFIKIAADDPWCKGVLEKAFKIIPRMQRVPIPETAIPALTNLACLALHRESYSNGAMGVVFAGFGHDEMFPKLEAFYSDGLINGRVKRQPFRYVDIHRTGEDSGARIEAFAQKEMVDRFLDGIDPDFEDYLQAAMSTALNDMGKEVVNSFVRTSQKNKSLINAKIAEAADKYLKEFAAKAQERKESNFREKILDMVNFMPKSDLANMAESLINLTSTKRRVSAEAETVGGPIDVAVISKYDGYVWIKRKHYFQKELNPRYFVAQKHSHARGGEHE